MCGDGLTDLVRIRNGEVCYWPNLGYGRFGAKVTMDNAPWFDWPDQFEQRRVRLADIDGSGTTDIIYLGADGVRVYFNQSGNRWSAARALASSRRSTTSSSVQAADLLGNGTACLVWSSPLPADARRPLRYIDLMGGTKPHLLVSVGQQPGRGDAGPVCAVDQVLSRRQADGHGRWITRLPFPVHVVERVETYDHISRNRFVTRYAYHHGYYDGVEREFRGFGLVEQWDTEEFAALDRGQPVPGRHQPGRGFACAAGADRHLVSHRRLLGRARVSTSCGRVTTPSEYYREPGLSDAAARRCCSADTVLPDGLTRRGARGVPRAQRLDAAPGDLRARRHRRRRTPYTVS